MVIQRWQSLLLLFATIFMAVATALPFTVSALDATNPESLTEIFPMDHIVYFILNVTVAALLFVSIFLFKNLRFQRMVTKIAILLVISSGLVGLLISYTNYDAVSLQPSYVIALIGAVVTAIWAYIRMGKDQKLLSSADRLR